MAASAGRRTRPDSRCPDGRPAAPPFLVCGVVAARPGRYWCLLGERAWLQGPGRRRVTGAQLRLQPAQGPLVTDALPSHWPRIDCRQMRRIAMRSDAGIFRSAAGLPGQTAHSSSYAAFVSKHSLASLVGPPYGRQVENMAEWGLFLLEVFVYLNRDWMPPCEWV